jgi:hypothetical protein
MSQVYIKGYTWQYACVYVGYVASDSCKKIWTAELVKYCDCGLLE